MDEGQIGYSIDQDGNSLGTELNGNWQEGWVVIPSDHMGDPIIVDTADTNLPILTSPNGRDEWITKPIASALAQFKSIVVDLQKLSTDRQSPV